MLNNPEINCIQLCSNSNSLNLQTHKKCIQLTTSTIWKGQGRHLESLSPLVERVCTLVQITEYNSVTVSFDFEISQLLEQSATGGGRGRN